MTVPVSPPAGAGRGAGHAQRWVGLGIILIGTLIVALDSTVVNIALPQIAKELHAGAGIQWVVTANLLANAVAMTSSAWLADRVGAKRLFLTAMGLFSLASLAAAFAPSLSFLIAARAAQGSCAGILNPVSMAIMLDLFPPRERGRAMGIWGLVAMTAPAVGPTLGGFLVTAVSWHWLFLPNVPIGLIGAIAGRKLLAETGTRAAGRLDSLGLFLGGGGLSVFLFGLSQSRRWGWLSTGVLACLALALVLLTLFVRHARRVDEPLLDLSLAGNRVFRLGLILISLVAVPQYARSVFMPLQLETLRDYTALKVGVILTPAAAAVALSMAIGGRLVDLFGARRPTLFGCALMLVGVGANAFIHVGTSPLYIAGFMTIQGLGVGIVMIPVTVTALNALPEDRMSQASTLRALTNQVAASVTVAGTFALVNHRLADATSAAAQQRAYNSAMLAGAAALVLALFMAWRLPD